MQIDQRLVGVDTTPPDKITNLYPTYERAHNRAPGGCLGSTSCDDTAFLTLLIEPVQDDMTPPDELGYIVELVDGDAPPGLGFPSNAPVTARVNKGAIVLTLPYTESVLDGEKPFDFTIDVYPVDRAGNVGEPTRARVVDPGDAISCASMPGGRPGADLSWLLLLAGLALTHRWARYR